jgi:hypothetical protein
VLYNSVGNAHRTEIEGERQVLYRWHPWAGCVVRVHGAIEKIGGTVLRCSSGSGASERSLEVPAWMFDRATCIALRVTGDPVVDFAALTALQELLAAATVCDAPVSSSNTPVSSPADQARNQNWGRMMRQRCQYRARVTNKFSNSSCSPNQCR